jgi:hypothetical protein
MRPALHVALITAACVAGYFGLRSLPVEPCNFLHYGDYVGADGVVDACGFEETDFFDLQRIRFPIIAELVPDAMPRAGEPVRFDLFLRTSTGRPIAYADIAISHTERLHLLVVDATLEDYQHLHPQPGAAPGSYTFSITPRRAGAYRVYFDFIPLLTSRRTLLQSGFTVAAGPNGPTEPASPTGATPAVRLAGAETPLQTGREHDLRLEAMPADGVEPPHFELVMGSYAHLVAFDAAGRGFAHLHPRSPVVAGQDPRAPELDFRIRLDQPGHYRVWAQIKTDGNERFLPFDLVAE